MRASRNRSRYSSTDTAFPTAMRAAQRVTRRLVRAVLQRPLRTDRIHPSAKRNSAQSWRTVVYTGAEDAQPSQENGASANLTVDAHTAVVLQAGSADEKG